MRMQRYSSIAWWAVCIMVLCAFLPMVVLDLSSRMDGKREPLANLVWHWEIAFGAESLDDARWLPFDNTTRAVLDEYEGPIWLQRSLPDLEWHNPYLFFSMMNRFEVYLDGERIYRFNMEHEHTHINPSRMLHPVRIDPGFAGKQLVIHAKWDGEPLFGHDMALIGEPDQFLYAALLSELAFIVYSIVGIAAGLIGFIMYARRKERVYGWFALFCLATGLGLLFACRTLQWFVDMKSVYYWGLLCAPLAVWACTALYTSALNAHRQPLIRAVHYGQGLCLAVVVAIAALAPHQYRAAAGIVDILMLVAGFATVTYALGQRFYRREKDRASGSGDADQSGEWRWLLRGYWTFAICGFVNTAAFMFPVSLTWLLTHQPYLYRIVEGMMPNALLLFMICMVMVMAARVRRVYVESERNAAELLVKNKELEQFHRNLEKLVVTRTSELEKANRTLAVTMRERAETLAEMSVLEERNRISYEMHDVVGHTLTAAIVQLEATRKLAAREGGVPADKLDLLEELVRKGLDDIRKAVRMMKSDEEHALALGASLRELIQFAEDTMEISVERDIALPDELTLGKVTEGVLYHALQEGLTNGIRHGGSSRFRFTLHCADDELRFLLVSDGEPYVPAAPGFGVGAMMERVELLGGHVSLQASTAADGSPSGCELAIRIPLSR